MTTDTTPNDAARAAAARTYPDSWETGRSEALAFIKGADWQRAQIVREMREYISRDESTTFAQGWNRAIEVVSARVEKGHVNAVLAALGVSES